MASADESTPLLGESAESPSQRQPSGDATKRIHFLDNLRAILTLVMICHHAAIFAIGYVYPRNYPATLPLTLFIGVNKSFLYEAFFFVSGCSIHLSLSTKTDSTFFLRRSLKTGLPAVLWLVFGPRDFEGPGSYVFTLLIFDYIYLLLRFVRRHQPNSSFARLQSWIMDSRKHTLSILIMSFVLVMGITIGNCFGLRLIPFIYHSFYPFEFPGFGAPVAYIIAYIAGINLPIVQQYILPKRPGVAVGHLVTSVAVSYASLGLAQHIFPALKPFLAGGDPLRYFNNAGWNGQTIFYSLWNPLVMYSLTLSLVSTFEAVSVLRKSWGIWVSHTYLQTYIHMFFVDLAMHIYRRHKHGQVLPVPHAIIGAVSGIVVSWAIMLVLAVLAKRFNHYIPTLPEIDIHARFSHDVEDADA